MGIGGISVWQLLIILVIVFLLFGTKRLRNLGGDLGGAIKGFKKAMDDDDTKADEAPGQVEDSRTNAEKVISGEADKIDSNK
jgi:sec-independent protein translocase protein TatA